MAKFMRRAAMPVVGLVLAVTAGNFAYAGGLGVREQSAQFQGTSFAGSAAGGALSSAFWNTAAIGSVRAPVGTILSDSSVSMILPDTQFSNVLPDLNGGTSGEVDDPAFVPASYFAYKLSDKLTLGVASNSPFGVATKVGPTTWTGRFHHQKANLFTANLNPMASYEVMPGLFVGAGLQLQYAHVRFETAAGGFKGDDIGVGFTFGVLMQPTSSTSIGLGYRSAVDHTVEGDYLGALRTLGARSYKLDIATPDILTFSVRQALSPTMRVMGTVEYTHWDKLNVHPLVSDTAVEPGLRLDFDWEDGWLFAVGGEWDYSPALTLRSGVAYEISPIQNPTQRLLQAPDSDRIWASIGASYKWSDSTTIDLAYSHVFFEDSTFTRNTAAGGAPTLTGDVENSADIVAVGVKTTWGGLSGISYK